MPRAGRSADEEEGSPYRSPAYSAPHQPAPFSEIVEKEEPWEP